VGVEECEAVCDEALVPRLLRLARAPLAPVRGQPQRGNELVRELQAILTERTEQQVHFHWGCIGVGKPAEGVLVQQFLRNVIAPLIRLAHHLSIGTILASVNPEPAEVIPTSAGGAAG
jgi:hypothetical protein